MVGFWIVPFLLVILAGTWLDEPCFQLIMGLRVDAYMVIEITCMAHRNHLEVLQSCSKLPIRAFHWQSRAFFEKSEFPINFLPHVQQVLLLSNSPGKTVDADTIQGRLVKKLSLLDAKFQTQNGCIGSVN